MAYGHADHASLEITFTVIAAASATVWTKVGSLPDSLALLCLNDLDKGFMLFFTDKQGAAAPANSVPHDYKFAAAEPMFVNYKNIGHYLNSCDVYVKKLSADPTSGSFRMTAIRLSPAKFKG